MRQRRASQRELPLGLDPYRNTGLFSDHFLDERLREMPWFVRERAASSRAFETLTELREQLNPEQALATANEEQTEEDWIRPVLQILGHHYLLRTPAGAFTGVKNFPDYALFLNNEGSRGRARRDAGGQLQPRHRDRRG